MLFLTSSLAIPFLWIDMDYGLRESETSRLIIANHGIVPIELIDELYRNDSVIGDLLVPLPRNPLHGIPAKS